MSDYMQKLEVTQSKKSRHYNTDLSKFCYKSQKGLLIVYRCVASSLQQVGIQINLEFSPEKLTHHAAAEGLTLIHREEEMQNRC